MFWVRPIAAIARFAPVQRMGKQLVVIEARRQVIGALHQLGFRGRCDYSLRHAAGWSSLVARWAHNPKVVGSNPTPATIETAGQRPRRVRGLLLSGSMTLTGCTNSICVVRGAPERLARMTLLSVSVRGALARCPPVRGPRRICSSPWQRHLQRGDLRSVPRSHVGCVSSACWRTTTTGHGAWLTTCWLTEPRSRPSEPAPSTGPDNDELSIRAVGEDRSSLTDVDDRLDLDIGKVGAHRSHHGFDNAPSRGLQCRGSRRSASRSTSLPAVAASP